MEALVHGERDFADALLQVALVVELSSDNGPTGALQELIARDATKTQFTADVLTRLRVEGVKWLRAEAFAVTSRAMSSPTPAGFLQAASAWARIIELPEFAWLPPALVMMTAGEASPILWLGMPNTGWDLLDVLVRCHTLAAQAADPATAERGDALTGLGRALVERFRRAGRTDDLEGAIVAYDEASALVPDEGNRRDALSTWNKATVLDEAGNAHRDRFELRSDPPDLAVAQQLHERAIAMTDDRSALARLLNDLGNDLRVRYKFDRDDAHLRAAIDAHERSLAAGSFEEGGLEEDQRAHVCANLGNELRDRYELSGDVNDLARATDLHRSAINATSPDTPSEFMHSLAIDLRGRYHRNGAERDLQEAIEVLERALASMDGEDPRRSMMLMDLGVALIDRHRLLGDTADVDGAVAAFDAAVRSTPTGSIELSTRLTNLGLALESRHSETGDLASLDLAVGTLRRAASLPAGPQDRANTLGNLGIVLSRRAALNGSGPDLDEAVAALENANGMTPGQAPERAWIGAALGYVLQRRYTRTARIDDLDRACGALREALDATAPDAPDWPDRANELGSALLSLNGLDGNLAHIEEGIAALEQAVHRIPEHSPSVPALQTTLAALLAARQLTEQARDDDGLRALTLAQRAVEATPVGSLHYGLRLSNLGSHLLNRYSSTGQASLLDSAIEDFYMAVEGSPPAAWDLPQFLGNLGAGYRLRHAASGAAVDLQLAVEALRRCSLLALEIHVETALMTGRSWGRWAAARRSWPEAAEALGYAIEAGERAFGVQVARPDKEVWLAAARGVPALAAYACAASGEASAAATALERGRATLVSEVLELGRTDLRFLVAGGRVDLAQRYRTAADRWLARNDGQLPNTVPPAAR